MPNNTDSDLRDFSEHVKMQSIGLAVVTVELMAQH